MPTIEELLEEILATQNAILTLLREDGISVKREYTKNAYSQPMSQDEKDALDEDIDLEWWFFMYGDLPRPAKYMDRQNLGYNKREVDYMHKRLAEIASTKPEVNGGTHTFQNVGKKYCAPEKNTLNCFACVPKEKNAIKRCYCGEPALQNGSCGSSGCFNVPA